MKEFAYMKVGGPSHNIRNGVIGWKVLFILCFDHFVFAVMV